MKVNERVRRLSSFDPSLRVVTPGFDESDLEDIETIETLRVVFYDEKQRAHGGRHKESQDGVLAVIINW